MEHVLLTEYIKDIILDNVTFRELNHLRCCSRSLQEIVSEHSEYRMKPYVGIIHSRISNLCQDKLNTIYDTPYIIIYNYYHTIIKYSYLMTGAGKHEGLQKLTQCLHDKKTIHLGHKFIFDTDRYKKLGNEATTYTLFEIMTCIYLYNTGRDWSVYHWANDHLHQLKFFQGTLLPTH